MHLLPSEMSDQDINACMLSIDQLLKTVYVAVVPQEFLLLDIKYIYVLMSLKNQQTLYGKTWSILKHQEY